MHVFVESNFVLELALVQQDHALCLKLLDGAQAGRYTLYVPQYALTEVFQTLSRRRLKRSQHQDYVEREIEQHRREADATLADADILSRLLNDLFTTRTLVQTENLYRVTTLLAEVAPGPPLSVDVLREAPLVQARHELTMQDALVYASVLAGLRELPVQEPKLFITRNKSDFFKPDLVLELRAYQCELLVNFRAAVGRLGLT